MLLYHLVATSSNHVIGKENTLPWHFSSDLKNFKKLTTGHTIIMGRKTYESIGKPLPNRENFVLTRNSERIDKSVGHLEVFESIQDAIDAVKSNKAFIVGGAEIYQQTLDKIDGIYLTRIPGVYEGDAFYPQIPSNFKISERTILQEDPLLECVFFQKK